MLQTMSLLLCLLLVFSSRFIMSDPLKPYCPNNTLYDSNSTLGRIYKSNLNILLSVLTANASRENGFYSFTTGDAAKTTNDTTIYGLFLCRGDVGASDCQDCVRTASTEVLRLCTDIKVAIIWYDNCMLRYSDRSIFSTVDAGLSFILINTINVTNRALFGQVLLNTFNQVTAEAAIDVSGKKFAVRESNVSGPQKIYALGQCTPDLSSSGCRDCLGSAVSRLPDYYPLGGRVIVPSCNVRYETYPFYNVTEPSPAPTSPLDPPASTNNGVSARLPMVIVFSISSCIMLLIICIFLLRRKSKKRHASKWKAESGEDDIIIDPESLQYSLSEIETATNNFSAENKIGQGGFGSVYKGQLSNGREVAVKRLLNRSWKGGAVFKNEIAVVAKLQHRNLVQLLGFCLEGDEKILVFEFVPRKSLDYFLLGSDETKGVQDLERRGLLNWSKRHIIIRGIARGLLYLHEDSRLTIVHRDLKAGNILLDENMDPKIADFGLAKICEIDESEGNTNKISGTFGYMAPEYTRRGHYSVKSDVFSFGVVILEMVTGKKNSTFYNSSSDSEDLITYAWRHWRNGTTLSLLDPTIGKSYIQAEVIQCVQIGLLCVEEDANKRPTMATVVYMLKSTSVTLPIPQCPAVLLRDNRSGNQADELEFNKENVETIHGSINELSITETYPR